MSFQQYVDSLVSHAQATGLFETVNGHQPVSVPQTGLTCGIWLQAMKPVKELSGLNKTSIDTIFNVRIYTSAVQQPYDAIDPEMMDAVNTLCSAYSGAFTLGGEVMDVDLLGAWGPSMSATAGYIQQDGITLRVMTITLPLIITDLWSQVP